MSPSSIDLEQQIGRPLKRYDILVSHEGDTYVVTKPIIGPGKGKTKFGTSFEVECISLKKITPYGTTATEDAFPRIVNVWSDIVPRGDRQDIGLIRRAYYRLKDKPPQVKPSP